MAQAVSNRLSPQNVLRNSMNVKIGDSAKKAMSGIKLDTQGVPYKSAQANNTSVQNTFQPQNAPQQQNSFGSQLNSAMSQAQNIQQGINNLRTTEQANKPLKGLVSPTTPTSGFQKMVGDITQTSTPTTTQTGLIGDLKKTATGNADIGLQARDIAKKYGDEIARIGKLGAGAVAGHQSTGSNVVGSGNAAIASQSASSRMNALANAGQTELQGTQQQLTGQSQQAGAQGQAMQGANTLQAQQLSGLGTAAGLAQPVQVAPGSSLFSPFGGDSIAGGLGGYADYRTAEQVMGLISQYPDAGYSYDQNLTPQQNLANAQQAIQGSNTYQKNTFGVPGQQTIAGAQQIQTAQQGYNQSYQSYQTLETQLKNADLLADNLLNVMQQGGINPFGAQFVDKKIKDIKRQFSSEQQQAFDSAMKEAQAAYSNVLISGGGTIPTEATEASNILLNPNSTMGAVQAAIAQLKQAAEYRLATQGDMVNQYYSQLQGASQQQNQQQQMNGGNTMFAEQW